MACRLPGGIGSPVQLWDALLRGEDLVTEVPPDRWDIDEYYDPEPGVPGRSHCKWGAFMDDLGDFDPEFFGIAEREAIAMDPQHRLLLETSWEAMEHAGLTSRQLADSQTGVFIGFTHGDYQFVQAETGTLEGPYGNTGTNSCMASGRVSYALGLRGPSVTVDTACSSGLFAAHLAVRSLGDGESDLAFAGGVYAMLEPRRFASGSANGMLSRSGRCHAFDVEADGFVSGEGAVVLLLKRLEDAQRDGDRILAVIRGTSANQDGHTVNIVTPSAEAQEAAYRAALSSADIDPTSVGMVEAHGTGTPVGDPLEYSSLAAVYGIDGPCAVGSVKTNFGHTQSTAGALGLMKAVLAVQHGVVPPNLHFNEMPEQIAAIDTKLFVPQEVTQWPIGEQGTPRRAAVSSYGMSGTNVHAVLEQAPPQPEAPATAVPDDSASANGLSGTLVFPISASSEDALRETAGRLADWVDEQDDLALSDLAYTLARRRGHRAVRTVALAGAAAELGAALREIAGSEVPHPPAVGLDDKGPVWVFSGQGSQWAQMGKDLLECE
ncbi:beta-ketoacyl synthase N-terminal-like domain-containing protein, partial [Mycobacterium sp.]|uniref:beta-ketoacyl synthase N-terminal-like domain-containing protein n=1 Tax=Mycobacterium sp. TaxID=1785 RepID=UPI003A8B788A